MSIEAPIRTSDCSRLIGTTASSGVGCETLETTLSLAAKLTIVNACEEEIILDHCVLDAAGSSGALGQLSW